MHNKFEELELLTSQLAIKQKRLLINSLNGQVSGQSCLDMLA